MMAEKFNKNGFSSSDFKRNSNKGLSTQDDPMAGQDGEDGSKLNEKAGAYMRDLLSEKINLNSSKFPISYKLLDEEVTKVQCTGRFPPRANKYLDVYWDRPVKVTAKVLVPVREHPQFNFVGKLLGPKGNTMKMLQDETMCKMAVLGRGSMRDRQKEEELRNSLDPKYSHLTDELHVEVSALAPPAEAHARIAYALAEVKKFLIPDEDDMIRQNQMHDIMDRDGGAVSRPPRLKRRPQSELYSACTVTERSLSYQGPMISGPPPRPGPPGRAPHRMPPAPPPMARPMPGKSKVISILDRARNAMESPFGYDDPYGQAPQGYSTQGYSTQVRGPPRAAPPEPDFYYEPSESYNESYYEDEPYYKSEFKASARDVGTRRPGPANRPQPHFARNAPYARPK